MSYGAAGGAAGAAAAVAVMEAIKASGAIVRVETGTFCELAQRNSKPLIIQATGGFFSKNFQYLISYKGFVFFTKSATPLILPGDAELIQAKKIWIPGS